MKKAKLFLLCPECGLEQEIKKHFIGELYFLSALGAIFDFTDLGYREGIHAFIKKENISEVIIVNDSCCRLIQSVINKHQTHNTNAEEVLDYLHSTCQLEILTEKKLSKRAVKLAELNIIHQAEQLRETPLIGQRLEKKEITLKGLVFERDKDSFLSIDIE